MIRRAIVAFALVVAGCSVVRDATPDPEPTVGRTHVQTLMTPEDRQRIEAVTAARMAGDDRDGYRIGPDDLLEIRIPELLDGVGERGRLNFQTRGVILPTLAETPTYERGERVNSHGEIIMPYLGTVRVEGLTPAEVETEIAARLVRADLLRKPQVSVDVVEYRHGVVAVMGSVQRPGLYPITRPGTTLADEIWAAGGPEKEAGRVVAFTPVNGTEPIRIDLERLIQPDGTADRELNPRVVPGDVISIAPAGNVLVDGWVDKPGSYPVTRGLTVTGAVAAAGGRLFAADPRKVTVKRTIGTGDQEVVQIDLVAVTEGKAPDFPLTDGDVVRMPSSWVRVVPWTVWQLAREVVNVGGNVLLF